MEQTEPGVLPLVRRLKARLAALYGDRLAGVYLYGSHARGEARPDSDVDVLVVLHGEIDWWAEQKAMADDADAVAVDFGEWVTLYPLSYREFEAQAGSFVRAVRTDAMPA